MKVAEMVELEMRQDQVESKEERPEPPCTDTGNAERFAIDHHLDVRYIHSWKRWMVWDSKRFALDTNGAVVRWAQETIRNLYQRAYEVDDKKERQQLAKWALQSEAEPKIRAMLKLAAGSSSSHPCVATSRPIRWSSAYANWWRPRPCG